MESYFTKFSIAIALLLLNPASTLLTYAQQPNPADVVPYCAAIYGIQAYAAANASRPNMETARFFQTRAAFVSLESQKFNPQGPIKFMKELDYMKAHLGQAPNVTPEKIYEMSNQCDRYLPTIGIRP